MSKKTLYKKVTFTLPADVVNDMNREIKEGEKSDFVYQSIKKNLIENRFKTINKGASFSQDLYNFAKSLPKFPRADVYSAREEGRL